MKSPRLSKFLALLIDRLSDWLSDRQASPSDKSGKKCAGFFIFVSETTSFVTLNQSANGIVDFSL
jgi:hypothetical protein